MQRLRLRILGRVQGVGYRHFVLSEARSLGLSGTVRNLGDGAVEVVAEGEPAPLRRLLERTREGPPHALVAGVEEQWSEGPPRFREFRVVP